MAAPLLLLVLLLGTTAAHKATLGDAEIEVNAFAEGTLRLRLRYRPDVYEVSDVVVGTEETSTAITSSCDAASCVFEHGKGRLQLSLVPGGDAGENGVKPPPRFQASYSASGVEVTKALLYMDAEQPKADFTFSMAKKLYGIPEHAVDLALKASTTYRLMNLDVFKYRLDDPGGIYGTIPFLMAHGSDVTAAVLFLNSADSSVGVNQNGAGGWDANWRCESGIHDIFFFAAGTPAEVHTLHAKVVGPTQMPPQFALGYHQCRWNYRSIADSLEVDDGFDTHNIPYDVLWLDIEHTDGKRYFTWDQHTFGEPEKLTSALDAKGRKLVTITDPHIKRDDNYHVHREARDQGFYVKTASGSDFEGHCWPGQSSWVDFYNANARAWYATLFKYDRYPGSAPNVYTWIDMNEPSVFNAHEVTMDKTAVHHSADGKSVAHRDVHNMYGFYHTMAAHQGHILRSSGPPHDKLTRPFILTRSFFSGSQRYAAMWTGDNMADWGHLRKSIPMLLTLSLSNYIFVGADVGGFFDNPSSELLVRWYQTAIFTPFLRGHAHLETKRREPWLFGDEVTTRIRNSIAMRYALMPYLYTTFFQAHSEGFTVMRPMFYHWPREDRWLEEQNAFMFGPALLVRPIVDEGATSVTVPLPASENWFEFPSLRAVPAGSSTHTVSDVTMDTIPLYLRGGNVLPVRERLRRSTAGMNADPITLYVAVNAHGKAAGTVYLDDTHSFDYQAGAYAYTAFSLNGDTFTATPTDAAVAKRNFDAFRSAVVIDKIVLVGLSRRPILATLLGEPAQSIDIVDGAEGTYILRRPPVAADAAWNIKLTF